MRGSIFVYPRRIRCYNLSRYEASRGNRLASFLICTVLTDRVLAVGMPAGTRAGSESESVFICVR